MNIQTFCFFLQILKVEVISSSLCYLFFQACLLTVMYLDPDATVFSSIQEKFKTLKQLPDVEAIGPAQVDAELYKETHGIVDMLRPGNFHHKNGWNALK